MKVMDATIATLPGDREGRDLDRAEEAPGTAAPGISAPTAAPAAGVEPEREVAPPGRGGREGGSGGAPAGTAAAAPRLHALALLQGAAGRPARAQIGEVGLIL